MSDIKPFYFSNSIFKFTNYLVNLKLKKSGLTFQEFNSKNFKIKYWDSCSNKPVLILLQAFTAESKFTWRKQVKSLSKKYRLILPNLIYFGGSTSSNPTYTINEQVDAINELTSSLKIDSYFVCGASYGGIIAMELALAYPEKIKKLIVIAAPIKFITDADRESTYKRYNVKGRVELLVPENYIMARRLLGVAYKNPPNIPTFIYKGIFENLYVPQAEDRKKLLRQFETDLNYFDNRIYHFSIPVLLIWGEEDHMVPLHVAKKMKDHIGDSAELKIIPKSNHLPNLEKSKAFNEILLEFLNQYCPR